MSDDELKQAYAEVCAQLGELESRYRLTKPLLLDRIQQLHLEHEKRELVKKAEPQETEKPE